jgi:hypothetical protein
MYVLCSIYVSFNVYLLAIFEEKYCLIMVYDHAARNRLFRLIEKQNGALCALTPRPISI